MSHLRTQPLVRVEGEGEIAVVVDGNNRVIDVEYHITEAPRFFEYIVRNKHFTIVPDLVSRICGLCGSSYELGAARAFEVGFEINVPEKIEKYRVMIHLAERIKSHVLHIGFLNLPDLIGTRTFMDLEKRNPEIFRIIINLVKTSEFLMKSLGGRIHNVVPIQVGGVSKLISREEAVKLGKLMRDVLAPSLEKFADFILSLETYPDEKQELVLCTVLEEGYPHMSTMIECNDTRMPAYEFYEKTVEVIQRDNKTALLYKLNGRPYVVGPIARFNKNRDKLHPMTIDLLRQYGWNRKLNNVFQGAVARIAETHDAMIRILEFLENYESISTSGVLKPVTGSEMNLCVNAIEAPRGILYHRYTVDKYGLITEANLVTPTAQNIAALEEIGKHMVLNEVLNENILDTLRKVAVAFDPCISCSVHSMRVKIVKKY
ncbi:MAG: nickel-dependent hydrogenase large subunit [Desulfurococcaceae archaeon]